MLEFDEIDGVMIGPYDISGSLGVPGKTSHQLVIEATRKVIDACEKFGKSCGTQIENPTIRKLIEVLMSSKQVNPAEIISHFEESDEREIISKLLIKEDQTTELIELAKDCLSTLSKISVRKKIDQLRLKIREMELTGENTSEMMQKIVKLQKELNV